jgi:hypothetical protein
MHFDVYNYHLHFITIENYELSHFLLKGPAADATDVPQPRRLIVQPYGTHDEDDKEVFSCFLLCNGGMKLIGETRSTRRETCPNATLSATNPTRTDPGSNSGLRSERPATSNLSHGTAN